jgi:hypothetical protein
MIGSETVAPERPAGAGYAASRIATAAPNEWPHGAALTIVGLPYVMSRASVAACPIPESILVLPTLRKWPSVNKERVSASLGARTYMIIEGTLDECIRKFMLQPKSQRHLYEIHTVPQPDLVSAILSTDRVVELARLRDFLGK